MIAESILTGQHDKLAGRFNFDHRGFNAFQRQKLTDGTIVMSVVMLVLMRMSRRISRFGLGNFNRLMIVFVTVMMMVVMAVVYMTFFRLNLDVACLSRIVLMAMERIVSNYGNNHS